MGEKQKSASPSAIKVKNRGKTIGTEEKLVVNGWLEKDEWIVDIMLDKIAAAYVQFVKMLIELRKVLSLELKCLCSMTTTVLSEQTVSKTKVESLLHFYCITNKYIVLKCMYTV